MRANLEDVRNRGSRMDARTKFGTVTPGTLTTNQQLDANTPPMILVGAAQAAVTVRLPPSTGVGAADIGQVLIFANPSANSVTLNTNGGAAFTPAIVAATGGTRVVCTGLAGALGWMVW